MFNHKNTSKIAARIIIGIIIFAMLAGVLASFV